MGVDKSRIREALADPTAPWYGSDLVPLVADLLGECAHAEAGLEYYRSGHVQNVEKHPPPPRFVPSRVRLNRVVRGDGPFAATCAPPGDYDCTCNRWGAVSVIATNGTKLGIKLNEFEVLAFAANPESECE